jgi:CTP:molybdopterin cytidylyltransferase MocA
MGSCKPLLPLGDRSLLGHCRALFADCGLTGMLVVVGHMAEDVSTKSASLGLRAVENPDYRSGMFSSVRRAVTELPADIDAFFMLPVDIPLIRPATVRRLLEYFVAGNGAVLYPAFAGRRGHPPLIPASLIPAILANDGAGGLEAVLSNYPGREIAVWDEGILLDADTPGDLQELRQRQQRISIPTRREAEALAGLLLAEPGLTHGRKVGQAAVALAEALNDYGAELDLDAVYCGGLLHDVAKGQPRHEQRGAELMAELGLPVIAAIVAAHKDLGAPANGLLTEREVVCLADKVVSGSRRIDLRERYAEKLRMFAGDAEACRSITARLQRALALRDLVEQTIGCSIDILLDEAGL